MSMEELLPPSPLRRKKGKHQARTSQQQTQLSQQNVVASEDDHLTGQPDESDAPEAYKFHCRKVVGNRWRDWKCRLKRKWYDKYDTDEQCLAITPPQNQFNQYLEEKEEDEQDKSFREEIFTKVMGTDAHGRICMYGAGVTPSQVFGQKSNSYNNENRMRDELEKQYQSKIDNLQSKLNEASSQLSQVMTHVGFQTTPEESESGQIPDASSMHQRKFSVNSKLQPNLDLEA
ncbi:PREDICTED: LOC110744993 [Prunus dulcis]|uniref:PREDICTED: LOC110744993 n=1 Tax=Prunus dulcis TaxID=3755 RepID=A0A5E4F6Q6_PRUDU|nr:PREDICTED: LOC110744993 [Prunus dulcis]